MLLCDQLLSLNTQPPQIPASLRDTKSSLSCSLSTLLSSVWADPTQLKAQLPANDEFYSKQWMNVLYVHALLCTWKGKAKNLNGLNQV